MTLTIMAQRARVRARMVPRRARGRGRRHACDRLRLVAPPRQLGSVAAGLIPPLQTLHACVACARVHGRQTAGSRSLCVCVIGRRERLAADSR